ncbi:DUF1592 domain-containing protein [Chondromyces crocatus]|uniref:CBM2 domain-containing protein n=1 Tax=Chondromyces crocatus TaxID=52 RepID=A0A0K1EDJ8_CHOCO|nr:DUF1592 domain-containing protein [Chondromyces crocatus]AKT38762.1 uncharacterized protein CMC5_029080 [Chondromyces crocatus]
MRKFSPPIRILSSLAPLLGGAALLATLAPACSGGSDDDASKGGCANDAAYFQANVWEPILSKKCVICHSEGGLAAGTRLSLQRGTDPAAMEANFEMAKALAADTDAGGNSVLLLKPANLHENGHTGGELMRRGSPQYQALETFVSRVNKGQGCDVPVASCDVPTPGARMLRRLSRAEYDATIRDLFSIESHWGAGFTADTVVNGFDNNAAALRVSPLLADQARRAADEIAAKALENPGALLSCDVAAGNTACAEKLVEDLGRRAFRRPLTDKDKARYTALYETVAAGEGFLMGVQTVISAMLQSPHFLYRTEIGAPVEVAGEVQLTQYEIAVELSYMLWGTMPDAELFAAADAGQLATPAQLEAQARRMLADDRSEEAIMRFIEQWLDIERLGVVPKDAVTFPEFDMAIRAAMRSETRRFVQHVVREGEGTLTELLTAKYSFVNPELAAFYGMSPGDLGDDGLARVELGGTPRAGIITQGSVLATHARPNSSSPIHRGELIREKLLCQPLPPPPPGLNAQPPPLDPAKTGRERYTEHSTNMACASCHRLVDPIGFAFEQFDGIGRLRDDDNGKPLDVSGEIVASTQTDGAFSGTDELTQKLAGSPEVHDCFSLQWMRFGYGVEEDAQLSCTAKAVGEELTASGLKVEDLIVGLVKARHFTSRVGDGSETEPVDGGSSGTPGTPTDPPPGTNNPPPASGLDVVFDLNNDWGSGYCAAVKVTNKGSSPLTWSFEREVEGTMTDIWNAVAEPAGAKTRFRGVEHNATLDPTEVADFGFCATR